MFTSDTSGRRGAVRSAAVWLGVALFCLIFNLIYARYSHGVSSAYMSYMYLYPLLGGALVYGLTGMLPRVRMPGKVAANAWNSGLAALTVGSLLRGIFEIAGTESAYQVWFVIGGMILLGIGVVAYVTGAVGEGRRERSV